MDEEEEGPLHHALHNFFLQGYVDVKNIEDVRRAGVQFLDVFKTILTNDTASAFETYKGGIPIEYSLKFHIFQVKKELHEFKATNPIRSMETYLIKSSLKLFISYVEQALKIMVMAEMKGKPQDHPTLFALISKFRHYIQCNSLAQVGYFWAHEFLKEFENTLQNNPMLLYNPQHIISIQHLLETTGNEYIMDPKNDPHSASHSFGTACFQAIQILSNYEGKLQAMAMSYHPRLGSQSLLRLIPPDVMQTIHGMSLHT